MGLLALNGEEMVFKACFYSHVVEQNLCQISKYQSRSYVLSAFIFS